MSRFRPYMVKNAVWLTWTNWLAPSLLTPPVVRAAMYRRVDIQVGRETLIRERQTFVRGPVRFGDDCFVNEGGHFDPGTAGITVEDEVYIGPRVVLAAGTHRLGGRRRRAGDPVSRPIRIGAGSWLGAGVVVLPGVTIAPGCVIAAGAVVRSDTEPDGVYAGVPARRVRDLDPVLVPTGG